MIRLLGMFRGLDLAVDNRTAFIALDRHATSISVVMLRLELAAQLLGHDENFGVVSLPHPLVELRRTVDLEVGRVRGALDDGVVVYTGID